MPDVPGSPRPVPRFAYGNHIIDNIKKWLEYANAGVGTAHDYSEEKFKEAFDVSDLPFSVDVLDRERIPEEFRKNIKKKNIVLQENK